MGVITFGTSGYRGIVGETFTQKEVLAIGHGVGQWLSSQTPNPHVVIACDPRTGNDPGLGENSFTRDVVMALLEEGVDVDVFDHFAPTPMAAWYIQEHALSGALILTASHNPPSYNGIKFNPSNGAPAPTSITSAIEALANAWLQHPTQTPKAEKPGHLRKVSAIGAFAEALIDRLNDHCDLDLDFLGFPLAGDVKYGTAGPVWDALIRSLDIQQASILHEEPRADFGNIDPNPTKLETLGDLKLHQHALKAPLAFANDPDADRHVLLDENGEALTPEETAVILMDYFLSKNIPVSGMVTTVASSGLVKRAAAANNLAFIETPVGFKYFAPYFEAASKAEEVVIGVESSGGISFSFHIPEKCGFMPVLAALFLVKETGHPLSYWRRRIHSQYGHSIFKEVSFPFNPDARQTLVDRFNTPDTHAIQTHFSEPLAETQTQDGLKLVFSSGAWVLFRLSGTEPIGRLYVEASTEALTDALLTEATHFLGALQ
ncbi:MAG: hypothetical protein AB7F28_02395 [Candidatus Margulisiibacteriota bacterium]